MSDAVDTAVFDLDPAERRERGITEEEVVERFGELLREGDREAKRLGAVHLPRIDVAFETVEGADNHPVDLSGATIEGGIHAERATVKLPVDLTGATVGGIEADNARFEGELLLDDATVTDEVDAFEARFDDDIECNGARFEAEASFDEATFDNDTGFDDATFEAGASFGGATFHGRSNRLDDNASFVDCRFEDDVRFRQTTFGFVRFDGSRFEGSATFEEVRVDGDAAFPGTTFAGEADFDEARLDGDADFTDATFDGVAHFRGATFEGGERALEADVAFDEATFGDEATFERARFQSGSFESVGFDGPAHFRAVRFEDDADFVDATFDAEADFVEGRFGGDADFTGAAFAGRAGFSGAEFRGDDNVLEESAQFEGARFDGPADFDAAEFASAGFVDVLFGGDADFADATFGEAAFEATGDGSGVTYVDMTGAALREGRIGQPEGEWVRYDLTLASVGDLHLEAASADGHRELLDFFRFCRTEFDEFDGYEFDFSDHTGYLDRNRWVLHAFDDGGVDREYAVEMTPAVIETTYLKAKSAASSAGNVRAAGEFRVKRQEHARRKFLDIATDGGEDAGVRLRSAGRVLENLAMGVTCGYGIRLLRIVALFAVVPLVPGLLYAFGGPLFRTGAGQIDALGLLLTSEGQAVLFRNVYFSYISYLTIGYGNIGPQGALARVLAAVEVYVSVILAGLVVYALVKRSEL